MVDRAANPMEAMADRVREILMDDPNISEKRMFGGMCFMLNGNMLCGPVKSGDLMLRVGKENEAEALATEGCREMDFTGKPMKGFVFVDADSIDSRQKLTKWIGMAVRYVGTLPTR
jgi:TfoX/Sxy family transcriptional regulator of competence genes